MTQYLLICLLTLSLTWMHLLLLQHYNFHRERILSFAWQCHGMSCRYCGMKFKFSIICIHSQRKWKSCWRRRTQIRNFGIIWLNTMSGKRYHSWTGLTPVLPVSYQEPLSIGELSWWWRAFYEHLSKMKRKLYLNKHNFSDTTLSVFCFICMYMSYVVFFHIWNILDM